MKNISNISGKNGSNPSQPPLLYVETTPYNTHWIESGKGRRRMNTSQDT